MKKLTIIKHSGVVMAALFTALVLSPNAKAQLSLTYEEAGGGHNIGDAFTGGGFRINLQDFDMGSIYPPLGAVGSSAGFGAGGSAGSVQAGINTLDGMQLAGATSAHTVQTTINGVAQGAASAGTEDSWGIARILTITDLAGRVIWSEAGKNAQLTVFFYGEKDFYIDQLANGFQQIDGVGLHVDLYLQSKTAVGYTPFNPDLGSTGRPASPDNAYATATDGTMILSTVATPGFIHDAGTLGGLSTEFTSNFNQTSGGDGQAYLSITGGTAAAQFNTNGFTSPFGTGATADLFAQFTTRVNQGAGATGDWLVTSNDPVIGAVTTVPVPEASTTMAGVACLLLIGGAMYRRRKQMVLSVKNL